LDETDERAPFADAVTHAGKAAIEELSPLLKVRRQTERSGLSALDLEQIASTHSLGRSAPRCVCMVASEANTTESQIDSRRGTNVISSIFVAIDVGIVRGGLVVSRRVLLFVGNLRDRPGVALFVAFSLTLIFTMGALGAFLIEMLLASRGLRDQANSANEVGEAFEQAAEGVGVPNGADAHFRAGHSFWLVRR